MKIINKISYVVICIIILLMSVLHHSSGYENSKMILFSLKYGSGDNQIAVALPLPNPTRPLEGDWLSGGPCDFWVDVYENVYFSDCGNHRLKKFDRDGNIIFISEYIDRIDMIAVGQNGDVYAITGTGSDIVVRFNNKGKVIEKGKSVDIDDGPKRFGGSDVAKRMAEIPGFSYGVREKVFKDKHGKKYKFGLTNRDYFTIETYEKSKKIGLKEIPIGQKKNKTLSLVDRKETPNLYVDDNGQFYAWGIVDREKPLVIDSASGFTLFSNVEVHKFNSDGKITNTITFPGGYPFELLNIRDTIRFGRSGEIYTVDFEKNKLNVVKYLWE